MEPERRSYCTYCDEYSDEFHSHENDGPMCECGHYEMDHHVSWFMSSGYKLVEECEYWGHAETGGMEYTAEGTWTGHCDKFREAK